MVAVLAIAALWVIFQVRTLSHQPLAVVQAFEEAWNHHDEAALRDLIAPGATFPEPRYPGPIEPYWDAYIGFEMGLGSRLRLVDCEAPEARIRCRAILEDPLSAAAGIDRTSLWTFEASDGRLVYLSTVMNVPRFKAAFASFREWSLKNHREEYFEACGLGLRDRGCGAFIARMAEAWDSDRGSSSNDVSRAVTSARAEVRGTIDLGA